MLKEKLVEKAKSVGFDAVSITSANAAPDAGKRLEKFLAGGFHAGMGWMEVNADRRADPHVLWGKAKSIIVLGLNYGPETDPLAALENRSNGTISVYARRRDYHDIVKKKLKNIARWLIGEAGGDLKVFVDTAPVMEKPLAQAAGMGWQGKHTSLVSRELGSWLFLGEIFTTLEIEPDQPEKDHCGSCTACLDICPTKAFPEPGRLDARRCISYLSIEHKGHIAPDLCDAMGNRIFGCDDCLAVCPWNKYSRPCGLEKLALKPGLENLPLRELAMLDDGAFRELFKTTPVKRTGIERFMRNVLIAIGNSGDKSLADCAVSKLEDDSPLIRAMAVRACSKLTEEKGHE